MSEASAFNFSEYSGCVDQAGTEVRTTIGSNGKVALAYLHDRLGPIIEFDWKVARTQKPNVLEFIYLHECGHHEYGHVLEATKGFDPTKGQEEFEADCYAATKYTNRHGKIAFEQLLTDMLPLNGKWRNASIRGCVK